MSVDIIDKYKDVEVLWRNTADESLWTPISYDGCQLELNDFSIGKCKDLTLVKVVDVASRGCDNRKVPVYALNGCEGAFYIPGFLSQSDTRDISNIPTPSLKISVRSHPSYDMSAVCPVSKTIRWSSLGVYYKFVHLHDPSPFFSWTTRKYEDRSSHFPPALSLIARHAAQITSSLPSESWAPDCALLNLYRRPDRLRGHKDDAEGGTEEPLVSISCGCPAVFLVGGESRADIPKALLLRDGDVVVLSGKARLVYHGVPKLLGGGGPAQQQGKKKNKAGKSGGVEGAMDRARVAVDLPEAEGETVVFKWYDALEETTKEFPGKVVDDGVLKDFLSTCRFNLSIRRIEKPEVIGRGSDGDDPSHEVPAKRAKLNED